MNKKRRTKGRPSRIGGGGFEDSGLYVNPFPPVTRRIKKRYQGKHFNRTKIERNYLERLFLEEWQYNSEPPFGDILAGLMGDGMREATDVTDRDRLVAATVIQWLGSEVGQAFLRRVENRTQKPSDE